MQHIFDEAYVVKIYNDAYKLVLVKASTSELSLLINERSISKFLSYNIGWWRQAFEKEEIILKKVEMIIPSTFEYAPLIESYCKAHSNDEFELVMVSVMKIDFPKDTEDSGRFANKVAQVLHALKGTNLNKN